MLALEQARERRIDELIAAEQAAKADAARAAHMERVVEQERLDREAAEYAEQHAKHTAWREKLMARREAALAAYTPGLEKFMELYCELAACDQMLQMQGFSPAPGMIEFRHIIATPDHAHGLHPLVTGSLQDRIIKVIQAMRGPA